MFPHHLLRFVVALVGSLAINSPAFAFENLDGKTTTIRLEAHEQRQAGKITGCGLLFTHLFPDNAYRNGGMVLVNGGIEVMFFDKRMVWTIKIHPNDVVQKNIGKNLDISGFTPTHAWINGGEFDSSRYEVNRTKGEDGSFIAAGGEGFFEAVELIMAADRLRFGFQRITGGIDATTEAILVSGPEDIERQARIARCVRELVQNMRSQQ
jgi:hypothetical protein